MKDILPYNKCELCGGHGIRFPKGSVSAVRCESCNGDKRSRKPIRVKKDNEELEL